MDNPTNNVFVICNFSICDCSMHVWRCVVNTQHLVWMVNVGSKIELWAEVAEWGWILMTVFLFLSNTFRVKRSPKKSPLSDPSQARTWLSIHLYCSLFHFAQPLSMPLPLYCRIPHPRMNLPPTHRMTMPQMKRSWPPPPATSGLPCMTWMRNWTLTNKTSLSHVTSRPLSMRTVFLIRPQVRLSCPTLFNSPFVHPATCVQIKVRDQSMPQVGGAQSKFKARLDEPS